MLVYVLCLFLALNTVTLLFISGHLANIYATLSLISSIYSRQDKFEDERRYDKQ